MTNFIPIFPLNVVVYPGEHLNLHIFEPRYKQLTRECWEEGKPFGIPTVLNDKVGEYGTLVQINSIEKEYENGELDIKTEGVKVFRVLEIIRDVPEKLYAGAVVNYPDEEAAQHQKLLKQVVGAVRELHKILQIDKNFKKGDEELLSYDIAHHAGLSLEEEYELLQYFNETFRLEYLKRHLYKVIPMMAEMENLKERVKLNGHFKNLSVDNF